MGAYGMLPGRMGSFSPTEADVEFATVRSRDVSSVAMRILFGFNSPIFVLSRENHDQILALSYLGPLRSPPERHYIVSGRPRDGRDERRKNAAFALSPSPRGTSEN
jgi:hypothetical protein